MVEQVMSFLYLPPPPFFQLFTLKPFTVSKKPKKGGGWYLTPELEAELKPKLNTKESVEGQHYA